MKKRTDHNTGSQNRDNEDMASAVINYPNSRTSNLFISSGDKTDGTYSNSLFQNNSKLIKRSASQIGLKNYNIFYCIPNINLGNNTIKIVIDGAPGPDPEYVLTITPQNYNTIAELYAEITSKLTIATGETFSIGPIDDCVVTLSCTKSFRFEQCTFMDKGKSAHGLFYTGFSLVPSMKAVPQLIYTSYIDVLISDIKDAEIGQSTFTEIKAFSTSEHLTRIYLSDPTIPQYLTNEIENVDYFPYRHRSLTTFQITIYDEYQAIIYNETQTLDNNLYEIPLIKYEMMLNIIA
jgi:hypothetical protein